MTIDDRPRDSDVGGEGRAMDEPRREGAGKERRGSGSSHAEFTRRDLERYAGLFAQRTKVMKSSAMRDLMAITERDDVISLAGGLPDTSTFPQDSYAALMQRVATESCARALQYSPTEGVEAVKHCIVEIMGAEGISGVDPADVLVTTGGQQVIDLVCKTLL